MTIINIPHAIDHPIAQKLDALPFLFFLGGSRRAAQLAEKSSSYIKITIGPSTDYDFYATYSESIKYRLYDCGFCETDYSHKNAIRPNDYPLDSEAVKILECNDVQVVLRKDADFYCRVFEKIPTEYFYNHLWKSSPANPQRTLIKSEFNALFEAAHAEERLKNYNNN